VKAAPAVDLIDVRQEEKPDFLTMARDYFTGLNPAFRPLPEWDGGYLECYLADPAARVRWVVRDGVRAGFVIFGVKRHPHLPWQIGYVYELFVRPEYRHGGIGSRAATLALRELAAAGCRRIDLEVSAENQSVAEFWRRFGFTKRAERWACPTDEVLSNSVVARDPGNP
jgi:ribosomal protein S18 acetylase RimI-like enzyme